MPKKPSPVIAIVEPPEPQPAPWPAPDVRAKLAALQQRAKDAHAEIAKASQRRANVHAAKAVIELSGQNFHEVLKSSELGIVAAENSWRNARQSLREFAETELRAGEAVVKKTFAEITRLLEEKQREAAEAASRLTKILDSLQSPAGVENAITKCDRAAAEWNSAVEGIPELATFRLTHSLRENVNQFFRQSPELRFFFDARAEFRKKLNAAKAQSDEFAAVTRR